MSQNDFQTFTIAMDPIQGFPGFQTCLDEILWGSVDSKYLKANDFVILSCCLSLFFYVHVHLKGS